LPYHGAIFVLEWLLVFSMNTTCCLSLGWAFSTMFCCGDKTSVTVHLHQIFLLSLFLFLLKSTTWSPDSQPYFFGICKKTFAEIFGGPSHLMGKAFFKYFRLGVKEKLKLCLIDPGPIWTFSFIWGWPIYFP
jgi:hypothetical protein